jgi:hypothetical protein
MIDVDIPLPVDVDCGVIEKAIDETIPALGLTTTMRDTLKKYPGCVHWHVKYGRRPGTLELTLWPQQQRAWFSVQSGRTAPWIEGKMQAMHEAIQERLVD